MVSRSFLIIIATKVFLLLSRKVKHPSQTLSSDVLYLVFPWKCIIYYRVPNIFKGKLHFGFPACQALEILTQPNQVLWRVRMLHAVSQAGETHEKAALQKWRWRYWMFETPRKLILEFSRTYCWFNSHIFIKITLTVTYCYAVFRIQFLFTSYK